MAEDTAGMIPGRKPRDEAVSEERRRRKSDNTVDPTLARFGVGPEVIDDKKYIYRAATDTGMRLHQLTEQDDYDFMTKTGEKASGAGDAGVIRYRSGTVDGAPQYAYLLRKLKKFADEDRAERIKRVDAEEKSRLNETPDDAPESYIPRRG